MEAAVSDVESPPFGTLTLLVTNQCPLTCAHCGPRSGPLESRALDLHDVLAALDEARSRLCRLVVFSGGEPFVLHGLLEEMVRAATDRGLMARVVTGAYWSGRADLAAARIDPLARAGLKQLFLSTSDHHRKAVPDQNLIEAALAAWNRGLDVYVNVGVSRTSATNAGAIRELFEGSGVPIPYLIETPVIPFGRAEESLLRDELILQPVKSFAGPCASLTEHPTIRSNGAITGCAVVFGLDCAPLTFGRFPGDSLNGALLRMKRDPLTAWIHKVGVVEMKDYIEATTPVRFADRYVNICHLCGEILRNDMAVALLRRGFPAVVDCPAPTEEDRSVSW